MRREKNTLGARTLSSFNVALRPQRKYGLLGTGKEAQDVHLDFHTASDLRALRERERERGGGGGGAFRFRIFRKIFLGWSLMCDLRSKRVAWLLCVCVLGMDGGLGGGGGACVNMSGAFTINHLSLSLFLSFSLSLIRARQSFSCQHFCSVLIS